MEDGRHWAFLGIAKVQVPAAGVRGHSLGPRDTPLSGKVTLRHRSQTLLAGILSLSSCTNCGKSRVARDFCYPLLRAPGCCDKGNLE